MREPQCAKAKTSVYSHTEAAPAAARRSASPRSAPTSSTAAHPGCADRPWPATPAVAAQDVVPPTVLACSASTSKPSTWQVSQPRSAAAAPAQAAQPQWHAQQQANKAAAVQARAHSRRAQVAPRRCSSGETPHATCGRWPASSAWHQQQRHEHQHRHRSAPDHRPDQRAQLVCATIPATPAWPRQRQRSSVARTAATAAPNKPPSSATCRRPPAAQQRPSISRGCRQ